MQRRSQPTSIELFTGAGGLALGVAQAGFRHLAVIEWNKDACDSLRANGSRVPLMADWPVYEKDVHKFVFEPYADTVDLIAAGAPCQPFSLGGKHRGHRDERNLFPEVFRAVRAVRPQLVIVENVKGLLRQSFRDYFDYIELQLRYPEIEPQRHEDWKAHKTRLLRLKVRPPKDTLTYEVTHQLANAANFGLPQRRERVFIVACRSDLGVEWPGAAQTHCEDNLLYDQYVSGDYWHLHKLRPRPTPEHLKKRVERLWSEGRSPFWDRWRTVRDALRGLPEPKNGIGHPRIANHVANPGARSYLGHTGSPLDEPAKTLKAGDHGVPGGENTLRRDDGSVRYFTVREAARLQDFPEEYVFSGAWSEGFRQLGNAVPVSLAKAMATVARQLVKQGVRARIA